MTLTKCQIISFIIKEDKIAITECWVLYVNKEVNMNEVENVESKSTNAKKIVLIACAVIIVLLAIIIIRANSYPISGTYEWAPRLIEQKAQIVFRGNKVNILTYNEYGDVSTDIDGTWTLDGNRGVITLYEGITNTFVLTDDGNIEYEGLVFYKK